MRKSLTVLAGILVFFMASISLILEIGSIDRLQGEEDDQRLLVAHCPTMEKYASDIEIEGLEVDLVPHRSSSESLKALRNNDVNAAVTGRPARENELKNLQEKQLKTGKTLVTDVRRAITKKELEDITVHTYLPASEIESIGLESEVVYHDSKEDAIKSGLEDAVLIRWSDYSSGDLLIVQDGGKKDDRFRTPHLFS